jgi:NDP-sugar pyrophosphorylase family protein
LGKQAIIMAGGKGVRLRPYSYVIPKPLAILGETPIIEILLHQLSCYGFDDIILLLGYKPEMIQAVVGDGSKWGVKIRCVIEEEPLGTVGGVRLVSDELAENFLVMNADVLTVLNYRRFMEFHLGNLLTLGTVRRLETIPLGVLETSATGVVIDYREKPIYHFLATMGINCFNRRILNYIPPGKHFGIDDLLFTLLKEGEEVKAFIFSGLWMDVGRSDLYEEACRVFEKSPATFLPKKCADPDSCPETNPPDNPGP